MGSEMCIRDRAQGPVRNPAIGHAHAQLQGLMPDVEGGSSAIQSPAPAPTAMFSPGGIAAHHNHSGAADYYDAGAIWEGPTQRCAFIAGGQATVLRECQGTGEQGNAACLQIRVGFDTAGPDRCCRQMLPAERLFLGFSSALFQGRRQAGANGTPEAFFTIRGIQMRHAAATSLAHHLQMLAVPATQPTAACGLSGIEASQ